ncbi:Protein of unknown function [Pyronema omphalodes CBS 100304]|uniref:Uncharacterized protein n=1 Tax=Pyronema omphalodes (strain CBS 100304) TaxID=1076935 RepID=U4KZ07_PYROM|nr:Protein of unknown function [Pyronema omphalodes CBS 100304]
MAPLSRTNGRNPPEPDLIPPFKTLLGLITPSAAASYTVLRGQFQALVRSLIKRHNPFNNPEYDRRDGYKIQDMMMECRALYPETGSGDQRDHAGDHAGDHAYAYLITGFGRLGNLVRYAYVGDTHFAGECDKKPTKDMCRQYMSWMGFTPAEVEECWRVVKEKGEK